MKHRVIMLAVAAGTINEEDDESQWLAVFFCSR